VEVKRADEPTKRWHRRFVQHTKSICFKHSIDKADGNGASAAIDGCWLTFGFYVASPILLEANPEPRAEKHAQQKQNTTTRPEENLNSPYGDVESDVASVECGKLDIASCRCWC